MQDVLKHPVDIALPSLKTLFVDRYFTTKEALFIFFMYFVYC